MLKMFFSDGLEARWWEADEKYKLSDFFNRKIFRVSDSSVTYRQINNLEENGLFRSGRSDDTKWRKLSFKEVLYLDLVRELRKFGFKNSQLIDLRDIFFGPADLDESKYRDWSLFTSDLIVGTCFGSGVEVVLSIGPDGEGSFSDAWSYLFFQSDQQSQLILKLNGFVNNILKKIGKKPFPIRFAINSSLISNTKLSNKEADLMSRIRSGKSNSITVRLKDGQPELAYVSTELQGKFDNSEVERLLNEGNFQDIRIVKRDGKIVDIKKEEVVKLGSTEQKNTAGITQ